jgi:hypothetical protein
MAEPFYFQWQNDVLLKTIYPLREMKLRDFLIYYQEIDLWAEYKNKNVASLQAEYAAAQEKAAGEAYRNYASRKAYFLKPDARLDYQNFRPLVESELESINRLHSNFVASFKYPDVRKEKYFVTDRIYEWELHRNEAQRLVASKQRRIAIMKEQTPPHPNVLVEARQLLQLKGALAMAEEELNRLYSFLSSFDKIEKRKLELFNMKEQAKRGKDQLSFQVTDLNDRIASAKRKMTDPKALAPLDEEASGLASRIRTFDETLNIAEEAFVVKFVPSGPVTPRDIVRWKVEQYKAGLRMKSHLQLLDEVVQRFVAQPERYPLWLQYMVIHFSGMRYASAHGSWADPKQLLISLRTSDLAKDLKKLDDSGIAALCEKTAAVYAAPGGAPPGTPVPKLALSDDPGWKEKIAYHLRGLRSLSPAARANALLNLRLDEENYEVEALRPNDALEALKAFKDILPDWMWKEITQLTGLRVTETSDPNWEGLTDEEQQKRWSIQDSRFRQLMDQWKLADITGWREEHDRSNQLIVTRAVCNEVAEHIQHLRGHSPPGGLTPKAPWYMKHESENKLPGSPRPYFKKPTGAADYTPGASILWLRFVEKDPNPWQVAHAIATKAGDTLLPPEFLAKKGAAAAAGWNYQLGDPITRTRTILNEKKVPVKQLQKLRWIHEATVAEVAETAEGVVVLTFETALPYEDRRLSSVGIFRHTLPEILYDGGEEYYNRSFVGFIPEGQAPAGDLVDMLNWNKILRRPFMPPDKLAEYQNKYIRRA